MNVHEEIAMPLPPEVLEHLHQQQMGWSEHAAGNLQGLLEARHVITTALGKTRDAYPDASVHSGAYGHLVSLLRAELAVLNVHIGNLELELK